MWYKIGKMFFWILFKGFFNLEISGQEFLPKNKGFILVSNHLSYLDPIVLGVASPVALYFMAKEELFKNPYFRWLLFKVNAFPLKRKGADLAAIRTAIKKINAGNALLIFPEGTRSADSKLGPGHEGVGFLANKLNAPVIPAFISGTDKALPKSSRFIHRAKIIVRFGKQISWERRVAYSDVAVCVMQAIKQLSCRELN